MNLFRAAVAQAAAARLLVFNRRWQSSALPDLKRSKPSFWLATGGYSAKLWGSFALGCKTV